MADLDPDVTREFYYLLGSTRSYLEQLKSQKVWGVARSTKTPMLQKNEKKEVSSLREQSTGRPQSTVPLTEPSSSVSTKEPMPLFSDVNLGQEAKSPLPSKPSSQKRSLAVLADYPELPHPFPQTHQEGLDRIQDILGPCTRCQLHQGRTHLVFGNGNPRAKLVFVGEGPGAEEDRTGFPFVGAAGDLLTRMIMAMGFSRDQVYICNVVKCRPPGNRTPEPEEIFQCAPFLRAQLYAIRPQVIVALGRTPTQFLLQSQAPISKLRGQFSSYEGMLVMPTFHPAYLLRTPSAKRQVWDDLKLVMEKLKELSAQPAI